MTKTQRLNSIPMELDLVIQVICNSCGAVTASQAVKATNPEARATGLGCGGLDFNLAPCCGDHHTCMNLVVLTYDEWHSVREANEPSVFNGTMVETAKELLAYIGSPFRCPQPIEEGGE